MLFLSGSGVIVRGVNVDDPADRKKAERVLSELGITYAIQWGGSLDEVAERKLGNGLPATVILDRDGQPAFRIVGEATEEQLAERVEWLLGDRSDPAPDELILPVGMTEEEFAGHDQGEHEHGEEEVHDHGSGVREGGSAVPT